MRLLGTEFSLFDQSGDVIPEATYAIVLRPINDFGPLFSHLYVTGIYYVTQVDVLPYVGSYTHSVHIDQIIMV